MAIKGGPVMDSYTRCTLKPEFFERFYENFLASNPAFREMFANTDFANQRELLRRGISMMLLYAQDNVIGKVAVERLAQSHGKDGMQIGADLYPFWVDSLMKTVAELDDDFSPELENQWRKELAKGIKAMTDAL